MITIEKVSSSLVKVCNGKTTGVLFCSSKDLRREKKREKGELETAILIVAPVVSQLEPLTPFAASRGRRFGLESLDD